MNKLAKIQHKIIELVVSSSAVPKAKASEIFHLTPSSSSVNCLARFHLSVEADRVELPSSSKLPFIMSR